ncbi:site-specific integrase [Chryseobacterium sp. ES2]|uniref:Site-specific integrase n=1 Tax=Chryseobacterium metallicongregator TaxID=3073042 RepID=A0ABU1DYJ2_9FLAO|nr:site-specific integrase [Chryseobacterium sp. ES2]MDR4950628.1 site-specific integrase [Chryseobacterium sp. ES2]
MKNRVINIGTKSLVILLNEDGSPAFLPNLYIISSKINLSEKRLSYICTVIRRAINFFNEENLNLEEMLINGDYDCLLKKISKFYTDYLQVYNLSNEAYNNHVSLLKEYFIWALKRYLSRSLNYFDNKEFYIIYYNKIENTFSFLERNKKHKNLGFKNIEDNYIVDLLNFLENKSKLDCTKFKDYLIIRLLLETGIRIGELLNLKTTDIIFGKKNSYIKILQGTTLLDTRFDKPRIKNSQSNRILYISDELSHLLHYYIITFRRNVYKTKSKKIIHSFVFISKFGYPLSKSSIQYLFNKINNELMNYELDIEKLTPHKLRHTFAYNFLKYLVEEKNIELERAKDELKQICGWKPSSRMPELYAGKYIWEIANSHNINRINDYYNGK